MRLLNNYGIITNTGEVVQIEAKGFTIHNEFVVFFDDDHSELAAYNRQYVQSVTKQNQYTEEEILDQIAGEK